MKINSKLIIPSIIGIALVFLFSMLFYLEMRMWDRVIIPFFATFFFSLVIYYILNRNFEDKFISKIFLISVLLHFVFILFWQLLKYYGLGLHMPTENIFVGYVSDVDGGEYHRLGVEINKYLNTGHFGILKQKMYGGFFPKFIGIIYHFTGTYNPFLISCINSLCAGFIAPIIYYIGKVTLKDISFAKLYSLFFIITFSHLMNTSTLIRDVYITFFMYLSILLTYIFYRHRNISFFGLAIIALYCLKQFRPYACYITAIALIAVYVLYNLKIKKQKSSLKVNKITMALIVLSPILIPLVITIIIKLTHVAGTIGSIEDLIHIREVAYSGSNSDYSYDFSAIYKTFPPAAIFLGMCCMFFAPFPWEWVLARRMIYIPDMLMFYCFLPSFFKNIKLIFKEKNYILAVFLFIIIFQFSIYCITLGNSGSIHRLRGPYLPMIYLIAMYRPDKFLGKLLKTVKEWRLV